MNKRFDIELGVFLHELSKNTFDCDGFDSLDSIVSTERGSAAANIIASISLSTSVSLVGNFTILSFFTFFINFP